MKLFTWIAAFLFCFAPITYGKDLPVFPRVETPEKKFAVGERLVYGVSYLKIPVGKAEAEVKEIILIDNCETYHIVVKVKSFPLIDLIYKVDDEHHAYIDTESLLGIRYEKRMRQGSHRSSLVMTFHRSEGEVEYFYPETEIKKVMKVSDHAQDQLSAGYWLRTIPVAENSRYIFPVHADEKEWLMTLETFETRRVKISGVGDFEAVEAKPQIDFVGMFVKRGNIRGWLSLDKRRVPLKMKAKIPILGSIVAELKEYHAGR